MGKPLFLRLLGWSSPIVGVRGGHVQGDHLLTDHLRVERQSQIVLSRARIDADVVEYDIAGPDLQRKIAPRPTVCASPLTVTKGHR
jgi:hypothetical protein